MAHRCRRSPRAPAIAGENGLGDGSRVSQGARRGVRAPGRLGRAEQRHRPGAQPKTAGGGERGPERRAARSVRPGRRSQHPGPRDLGEAHSSAWKPPSSAGNASCALKEFILPGGTRSGRGGASCAHICRRRRALAGRSSASARRWRAGAALPEPPLGPPVHRRSAPDRAAGRTDAQWRHERKKR